MFKSIPKKKLKNLYFVAGSEVPFAGGGTLKDNISKLKDIKKDFTIYNSIINPKKKLSGEFALVIEPGMNFSNNKVTKPNLKNLRKISKFSKDNGIFFEAHSTDYQKIEVLKKLVKSNFKFLKVGPELTYKFNESIKFMLKIENVYTPTQNKSNLKRTLDKTMKKNPKYWKTYYKGSADKVSFLKFNSLLDRIRYYWNFTTVNKSKEKLFYNINKISDKKILKHLRINKKIFKLYKKYRIKNSDLIIINFLDHTIFKYYKACGFKLHN